MADLKGKAVLFAVGALTYSAGITIAGTSVVLNQNQSFSRQADTSYIKDNNGENVTMIVTNKRKRIKLKVIPAGTAIADAKATVEALMLAVGTGVTLADPDTVFVDATQGGKYYIVGEPMLSRTVDGAAEIDLELEQHEANDLSVTAS